MQKNVVKVLSVFAILAMLLVTVPEKTRQARAISSSVVISQVYGGGGNSGSVYKNDYIEIFNRGESPISLTGWSVQYASASGASWAKTDLSGTVQPGQYYLIQEAAGSGGTQSLPTPDATGSLAMSATNGKVALVSSATLLSGACPSGVIDLIGFGTANCFETSAVTALTNTTAAKRNSNGCAETDDNSADFTNAAATADPVPRNTSSTLNPCSGSGDTAPDISSVLPDDLALNVLVDANVTVAFSEAVGLSDAWFELSCSTSGLMTAVVSGGPTSYTINPDVDFIPGESCTLTVSANKVSDVDANDPPDAMTADFISTFTVVDVAELCAAAFTPIYDIQGSGDTAAITEGVTTQGIVISDDEGASPALGGFYLQDLTGDGNHSTSDGLFVFNGANNNVANGDIVRVTGTATEYQGETQISSVSSVVKCGTGTLAPTDISLPFASIAEQEQYEGMLVRVPQTLYVTEHYLLGRFGEVVLSGNGRLDQPTSIVSPGATALAVQSANDLNKIILDDNLNNQNPDPILFGRGGNPLSASNTLRGGDTITDLVGVMTYGWGGNSASPNAYRIRPIYALGGGIPNFVAANPRPVSAPSVGGTVKAVGMNLLNYFNTFGIGACTNGVGGPSVDCRGAGDSVEFTRQSDKTMSAILAMNADVIGIIEIENDGYGSSSAVQDLVNKLNNVAGVGTYTFIDVDARAGKVNALGSDAIKVGILYKPASVSLVGTTAVLDTTAFVNGGDLGERNRVSLLQAFESSDGERFLFNVNHLKSKGGICDTPDAGDGQGNCNIVRTNAVNELVNWFATDPTGTDDPDLLIVGDLNSYAKEDPIAAFEAAGYVNMVNYFGGEDAYSYVFDGQWGYLDYAIASPSLLAQTTGVADWHINADEPSVLDYNTDFKSVGQVGSLYSVEPFRVSDHDPVIVGLGLDSIAPETLIESYPANPSNSDAAEFTFSSSEPASNFECRLDSVSFAACTSPVNFIGLNDGVHNFQVRAMDTAGNVDVSPASSSWTVDTVAPTVISIARARSNPTNYGIVTFAVTFSEVVAGVDKTDFSLIGTDTITTASITSVMGTGATRTVVVNTGLGSGTIHLDLIDDDSIKDAAFISLGGVGLVNGDFISGDTYTVDRTPPSVVSIVRIDSENITAYSASYIVTFSEAVIGVDRTDFSLEATGLAGASLYSISGTGSTRTVTVLAGTGTGTLQLNLIDNDTIKDLAQNKLGGIGSGDITAGEIYTVDRTPPTVVSIVRAGADPATTSIIKFTVTFSENVTGVDKTDFALDFTGLASAAISSVRGSGTTYTVTVIAGLGTGTLSLDLNDNDSIRNLLSAQLGGFGLGNGSFTSGETYTVNRTAPAVVSIVRANAELTNAASVKFIVTFSEPVTGVDGTDFNLVITGDINEASITSIVGGGASRIIIVRTVAAPTDTGFGTLHLDLDDDDTIVDASLTPLGGVGLENGDFISSATYTVDRMPPTVTSILRASPNPTSAATVSFTVTFTESVTGVDKNDFRVSISDSIVGASVLSVTGSSTTRTVTIKTGTGTGTIRLDLIDNDTIRDARGNPLGGAGLINGDYLTGEEYIKL
ncbi:MAG: ExeM/NucH family extracellular endonuclease [Chloroflexi bacterium]|nr:ExeM/NucH family extracellular endonuclease [Chloroflexota bacterium]